MLSRLVIFSIFIVMLSACSTVRPPNMRPQGKELDLEGIALEILTDCSETNSRHILTVLLLPSSEQVCVSKYEAAFAVQILDQWVREVDDFSLKADHTGVALAIAGTAALLSDASTGVFEAIGALAIALTGYRSYQNIAPKRAVARSASDHASCLLGVSARSEYWLSQWEALVFENETDPLKRAGIQRETEIAIAALEVDRTEILATYNVGQSAYLELPTILGEGLRKLSHYVEDGFETNRGSVAEFANQLQAISDEEAQQEKEAQRALVAAPSLTISRSNKGGRLTADAPTLSFNAADLTSVSSELVKNVADARKCNLAL